MKRLPLAGLPLSLLAAFVFFVAFGAPWLIGHQPRVSLAQPIDFDHQVHTKDAGLDCLFCHRSAVAGVSAGLPSLQQCMACHGTITAGQNQTQHDVEIEKVRKAWQEQKPVDWLRIHRLPDHVRFEHAMHIKAGLSCAACHGDVSQMSQVTQVRPLHMADCVGCHQVMQAPTECSTCHY
jgi:hypothetical protein